MPVQDSDSPVQQSDTPVGDGSPVGGGSVVGRLRREQIGSVGAWFLRLRPWIAAPPSVAATAVMASQGVTLDRLLPIGAVQVALLGFFFAEAYLLYRRGTRRFVTARQLWRSLVTTLLGVALLCGLTGAWRSPFLPVLLAPTGVAFAAFGVRPRGLQMLGLLTGVLLALAGAALIAPWPLPAAMAMGPLSLTAVLAAAVLLFAGVAGLTGAHFRAQQALDRMRRAVVAESGLRVRDLEAVGGRVAHDLRNPLATVTSLLQLLERSDDPDKNRTRAKVALVEAERIDRILAGYLSLARPLRDLEPQMTDPGELVRSVARSLEPSAADRDVEIAVETAPNLPAALIDETRIRDALLNLGTNAIQATPASGRVTFEVVATDRSVEFRVVDTGRGLTAPELERIGTPFFTTRDGGTGLGVASAMSAARQHGGELVYESREDEGTCARMRLPFGPDHGANS